MLWSVKDNQSADDLAIGTCFDIPTSTSVSTVTKIDCTVAHDAEVFLNNEYTGDASSYPISLTLDRYAGETCTPAFETYSGQAADTTNLTIGYFYPTRDGWEGGDRTITCYAYRGDGVSLRSR